MKRPSYKHAIALVALNDGNGDSGRLDREQVEQITTVQLIADLFGIEPYKFARDIVDFRISQDV